MAKNIQKEFRDEMTSKMKEMMKQCEKVRQSKDIAEDVKEKEIQQLWDTFVKEFEEAHSMPGYKEARKPHIKHVEARIQEMSKDGLMEKLARAKNIEEKVKVFAKITDKYGLEAILGGIIPWAIGDAITAIGNTIFLIYQGKKIGLSGREIGKIIGYQAIDFAIGAIVGATKGTILGSTIGTAMDYLCQSNIKSSQIFTAHVRKLEEAAREKGATNEEISQLGKEEKKYLTIMQNIIESIKYKKKSKK